MSDTGSAEMTFAAGGLVWRHTRRTGDGRAGDGSDDEGRAGDGSDDEGRAGDGSDDERDSVDERDSERDDGDGQWRLAVVHRPRYDDWSIPKGKLEPGELLPETALREVTEETGCVVRREGFAGRYQYEVASGPKTVFVWHMRLREEGEIEVKEVDQLVWLTPDDARERLSYADERALVGRVSPPSWKRVYPETSGSRGE